MGSRLVEASVLTVIKLRRWVLEHQRDSLSRADAAPEHAVAGASLPQLGGQGQHVAGSRRTEGMADRNRPAVGVETLVWDLEAVELVGQLAQDREGHRSVG